MAEKERLKFCIDRFDHYYDSINSKSAVFLALSTFIVGGLVAVYPTLLEKVHCNLWVHILMICPIGIGLAIMITVIGASTPFLSRDTTSIHYFGSISSTEKSVFDEKSRDMEEESELADLRDQVYQLACGLRSKFSKLRTAGILFTIQFILFIPLIILLIINLKKV